MLHHVLDRQVIYTTALLDNSYDKVSGKQGTTMLNAGLKEVKQNLWCKNKAH